MSQDELPLMIKNVQGKNAGKVGGERRTLEEDGRGLKKIHGDECWKRRGSKKLVGRRGRMVGGEMRGWNDNSIGRGGKQAGEETGGEE
ncbi:hypothetical protein Pcinc_013649 [Petrolisthes cinctipes]|uniref:Uncharacterized protein n=1 Tax=Petrolisthes cinctipes TaxID=88211 RepID=A0AAE1KSJ8_PETCI|nr:hypothetical protein Pcinc_013649 [Petrolisthes cinctipes]